MKLPILTRLAILAAVLLQAIVLPGIARAQGIIYGDTIPAGMVVDQDIVLIGQNVSIAGTVNGNVFILGNQIKIDGLVNGSLVLIGQNASISGKITGGAYALALTIELSPGANLERDLYATTVSLVSGRDSVIQRDLLAISLDAGLGGRVERDLYTAIGPIQLYNGLMRLLGFEELTLALHFEMPQPAATPAPAPIVTPTDTPTPISMQVLAHPQGGSLFAYRVAPGAYRHLGYSLIDKTKPFDWEQWAIDSTRNWIVLSLFGLLALWLAPGTLERSGESLRARPWYTSVRGLLVLVIAVNLFGVATLLAALIFSIGLGLNYLGVWQVSIALWVAAYSCLALAVTALWFLIVYGTKIIVVHALVIWLFDKTRSATWYKITVTLLGMLLFVLLRSIPYIGWVLGVLVTAAGLGSVWLGFRSAGPKSQKKITPKDNKKSGWKKP